MTQLYLDITPPKEKFLPASHMLQCWQMIEATIESLIWGLAGVSTEKGRAITAHMPFPLRCDVLRGLYHDHFKKAMSLSLLKFAGQARPEYPAASVAQFVTAAYTILVSRVFGFRMRLKACPILIEMKGLWRKSTPSRPLSGC